MFNKTNEHKSVANAGKAECVNRYSLIGLINKG